MASIKHTHKYILRNVGSKEKPRKIYACSYSDCSHYMPSMDLVIGKKSICWKCDGPMVMTRNITRKFTIKPKCHNCRKFKAIVKEPEKVIEQVKLDQAVEDLLSGLRGMK